MLFMYDIFHNFVVFPVVNILSRNISATKWYLSMASFPEQSKKVFTNSHSNIFSCVQLYLKSYQLEFQSEILATYLVILCANNSLIST